jgi:ATP-dependent helicase Lhr and Lhr-like helicase
LFPFDGRLVHEGLAALVAWRLGKRRKATFGMSMNDYGIEVMSEGEFPFEDFLGPDLFSTQGLIEDVVNGVNVGELAKRQFREIARVAGLVMQRYPGAEKSGRQLQAGASLLYEVFEQFDPNNLLLHQARREVLERQFEQSRLARTLERLKASTWRVARTKRLSPLAFPLVVDRLGSMHLSTESLMERIERMKG